jgi:hypothetical protein
VGLLPGIHRCPVAELGFLVGFLVVGLTLVARLLVVASLMLSVFLVSLGATLSEILAMKGQSLVRDVVMLDSKLGLRLNLVVKLVVLVFDIVHQIFTLMVVNIVAVDVTSVVVVILRVVTEVLFGHVVVIVMTTSPERSTGVMLLTLMIVVMLQLLLVVKWLHLVLVEVVEGWVLLSVVHDPFVLGFVGLEQG